MFELYGNNELIGTYSTRLEAVNDAFELMLDGALDTFEIVAVPSVPQTAMVS